MSQPPPPFLLPERPGPGWCALLAGAGRQRVAVALLALAALLVAGVRLGSGHAHPGGWREPARGSAGRPGHWQGAPGSRPAESGDGVRAGQTLPRAAPDTSAGSSDPSGFGGRARRRPRPPPRPGPRSRSGAVCRTPSAPGRRRHRRRRSRRRQPRPQAHRRRAGPDPRPRDPPPALPPGGPVTPAPAAPLDLNTATVEQLDTLPGSARSPPAGSSPTRSAHPFTAVDELLEVPGIGQRRFEQLKDLVTVTDRGASPPACPDVEGRPRRPTASPWRGRHRRRACSSGPGSRWRPPGSPQPSAWCAAGDPWPRGRGGSPRRDRALVPVSLLSAPCWRRERSGGVGPGHGGRARACSSGRAGRRGGSRSPERSRRNPPGPATAGTGWCCAVDRVARRADPPDPGACRPRPGRNQGEASRAGSESRPAARERLAVGNGCGCGRRCGGAVGRPAGAAAAGVCCSGR
jgi:competence protein ComEA